MAKQPIKSKSNNIRNLIIIIIVFIVVIVGSIIAYNFANKNVKPQQNIAENSQENSSENPEKILAPNFTVYNKNNEKVNLSDYKGKPIVLNFWASWCTPCKIEMPYFDKFYKKHGKDIEVLMVNLNGGGNDTKEKADKFIADGGYSFPVYYDTDSDAAYKYGIISMPTTLFIDKDGYAVIGYRGAITEDILFSAVDMLKK